MNFNNSNFVPTDSMFGYNESQFCDVYNNYNTFTNKYIYVNQNVTQRTTKVLINPNFKTKIHVNPNFNNANTKISKTIHVNPELLNGNKRLLHNITSVKNYEEKPIIPLIDVPKFITCNNNKKLIRVNSIRENFTSKKPLQSKNRELYVKNDLGNVIQNNKFKVDRRDKDNTRKNVVQKSGLNLSTKYVFIKNAKLNKTKIVRLNGILYKCSSSKFNLKRAKLESSTLKIKTPKVKRIINNNIAIKSKFIIKYNNNNKFKFIENEKKINQYKYVKKQLDNNKYKFVRKEKNKLRRTSFRRHSIGKLKKCNLPCKIYQRYGKCLNKEKGKCLKMHNPEQITLCPKFLRGACLEKDCLLSHNISPEKMPTCNYFLQGRCFKDDCQYLHVKVSAKADICKEFLHGFCKLGKECDKRHQYLCPDFEKNNICKKVKCPYPHGNMVRNVNLLSQVAKRTKLIEKRLDKIDNKAEEENIRYYTTNKLEIKDKEENIVTERCKIGTLPTFIPLFESMS